MLANPRSLTIVGAVAAVLLQVLVAPHIAIGYGMPNVIAAYCLVVAVVQPGLFRHVLPFAMGLVYDLISGGPVGAMAFSLTAVCAFASWFFRRSGNDTVFMGLASLAVGALLAEFVYGVFFLMFGYSANLLDAFVFRILPCFLYDAVIVFALYPLALRFLSSKAPLRSEITQLH